MVKMIQGARVEEVSEKDILPRNCQPMAEAGGQVCQPPGHDSRTHTRGEPT